MNIIVTAINAKMKMAKCKQKHTHGHKNVFITSSLHKECLCNPIFCMSSNHTDYAKCSHLL